MENGLEGQLEFEVSRVKDDASLVEINGNGDG